MSRALTDLPFARRLTPFDGELESDQEYDNAHVADQQLEEPDCRGSRFIESALTELTVLRGSLRFTRFADVWMRGVRLVGTNLGQSDWQDAELVDSAWSGVEIVSAGLRRIRFEGCKFESVNFRNSNLREVEFVDCVLRDVDFAEAALRQITFPGSTLMRIALDRARLQDVDLRGARSIDIASGLDALRGATINYGQLMDLAPAFAQAAGIIVRED
ncbi:pentapeptide repeat-containing protein [Nocardia sp. XZ_19_385]|uniref:pentapeptide repeat-containing protein n=1 Tax=Nocardia sp. XZ_19_385 TaxID=2769488 RepID=UPI00188E4DD2|nr:pentapeptide repeat-containing protein [Nocardia sp. XZ_19_385]